MGEFFQSDSSVESCLNRLVNDPQSPASQFANDFVVGVVYVGKLPLEGRWFVPIDKLPHSPQIMNNLRPRCWVLACNFMNINRFTSLLPLQQFGQQRIDFRR